jgi:hypothetical protein
MTILEEMSKAHKERIARLGGVGDPETAQIAHIELVANVKQKLMIGPMAIRQIQKIVAKHFGVSLDDMLSPRRNVKVALPRMISMLLAKEYTSKSLVDIGRFSGGRDHSTVISALKKAASILETNEVLHTEVNKIRKLLDDGNFEDSDLQTATETAVRNAWIIAREIEGYRRHRGARKYLATQFCQDELELARDYLSRVLDDMRGVK